MIRCYLRLLLHLHQIQVTLFISAELIVSNTRTTFGMLEMLKALSFVKIASRLDVHAALCHGIVLLSPSYPILHAL